LDVPTFTSSRIGKNQFDPSSFRSSSALAAAKAVALSSATKSQQQGTLPLLWLPSQSIVQKFEDDWRSSDASLLPAVILLSTGMILSAFVAVRLLAPRACKRCNRLRVCSARTLHGQALGHVMASDMVGEANGSDFFPSCTWRGHYNQYGQRHNVCSFPFVFEQRGNRFILTGSGQDTIGKYEIDGYWNPETMRVAFVKEYERGSINSNGRVDHRENKGHKVLYQGRALPHMGQGIKGTWSVETAKYRGSGDFHLWPEQMPALSPTWFRVPEASAPPLEVVVQQQATAPPLQVYDVTPDGICVVCLERQINVALAPCGHIAVCSSCGGNNGQRLHRQCPICRQAILHVIPCRAPGSN